MNGTDQEDSQKQIELQTTGQLSARSNESIEMTNQITQREERLQSLGQLSALASQEIQKGLELSTRKNTGSSSESDEAQEDSRKNSFETEDLDSSRNMQRVQDTDRTIEDDEEMHRFKSSTRDEQIENPRYIGRIRCFLHDKNGRPRVTIGPNWGFTIVLVILVSFSLYTSVEGMQNMYRLGAQWYYLFIGLVTILFGLSSFFLTLLGDPGIPDEIYFAKARPHKQSPMKPAVDSEGNSLCMDCNVYKTRTIEHCNLCGVCIENLGHHCVFYSKCIGGGNIIWFRMSLFAFVVNMTYFIVVYGFVTLKPKNTEAA